MLQGEGCREQRCHKEGPEVGEKEAQILPQKGELFSHSPEVPEVEISEAE